MAKKANLAIIGLIVILLASFVITAVMSVNLKSLKEKLSKLNNQNSSFQQKISVLSAEKRNVEAQLVDLGAKIKALDKDKDELQHKNQELSFEISRLSDEKIRLEDELKTKEDSSQSKINELQEKKTLVENSLLEIERKNKILEDRISTTEKILKDKEKELVALKNREAIISDNATDDESVELSPILVKAGMFDKPGASTSPAFVGKVLGINKEKRFVIINLGSEAGVKIGAKYAVYKKDRIIAELKVIQVRDNISACDIFKEVEEINLNDIVK